MLVAMWINAGLGLSGWTIAVAVVAAAGAAAGLWMLRIGKVAWAPLAAWSLVLLATKMYGHFGKADVVNERRSPRPACAQVRAEVPPGEALWLGNLPSASAAFYLDALPLEFLVADEARLAALDRLFVCVTAADRATFEPPAGFRVGERHEFPSPDGALLLLRLDRASAPDHR